MRELPPPDERDEHFYSWRLTYDTLIDTFEVERLLEVSDDDYQGDSYAILGRGDERGLLIFGWGSCSGCDALQACTSREEVTELRDQLWNSVHWEQSATALANYVESKDARLEWYGRDATWGNFRGQALALLRAG